MAVTRDRKPFMQHFAESARNIVDMTGFYDPQLQRWICNGPTMRTNYQTWNNTQRTTSTHTQNGDYVPDYPGDLDPDTASD